MIGFFGVGTAVPLAVPAVLQYNSAYSKKDNNKYSLSNNEWRYISRYNKLSIQPITQAHRHNRVGISIKNATCDISQMAYFYDVRE